MTTPLDDDHPDAPADRPTCLCIAYDFSTKIMGGSVRMIKFAQYLPAYGWTPHVLTASPPEEHPALPEGSVTYIPSPERGFGGGIAVAEPGASELGRNPGWMARLSVLKDLLPLERQITWFPSFLRQALQAAEGRNVQAVVSTSAPYVIMLLGRWLARRLGVPHIVDIRDDWQGRHLFEDRSWLNQTLLDLYCSYVVRRAAAVSVVSWRSLLMEAGLGTPIRLIPNGYDEPDFAGVPLEAPVVPAGERLRIMHLGWLGDYRSIEPVLRSIQTLRATEPAVGEAIEVHHYGLIEQGQLDVIARMGMEDVVTVHPQVPHAEAIQRMTEADVLLVIPGSQIPAAVTGKIFEYLRARRPILLWGPEGAAMDLAVHVGLRHRVLEGDEDGLTRTLATLVAEKRAGTLRTHTDPDRITPLSREAGAAALADVLNEAVGRPVVAAPLEAPALQTGLAVPA